MALFRKKRKVADKVEARFQQAVGLIRDLDRREFNRLIDGLKLTWEGYNRIRAVQTNEDKEVAEIEKTERALDYLEQDP
jgi:hypothetical protein